MELNNENSFSAEMQMKDMGTSQFKAFCKCEAAALAEIRGEYVRPKSIALLVGSYVDAHFEGTLDLFKAQNPELFKKDGSLKSDYIQAEQIINRIEQDELFMLLMSGKKQVIRTGEIAGVPYKIKIDSYIDAATCKVIADKFPDTAEALGFLDSAIVDLKYMRDTAPIWIDGVGKAPFVEAWGYDIQGAIYQAVEGNMLPFILAVATKEDEAGLSAFTISQNDLDAKLMEVEEMSPRFQAIKDGLIEPERCEDCAYCRKTRKLTRIIDYKEILQDE